jgi:flagellar basal-body rod protein FlgG
MNDSLYIAATGMMMQQKSVDTIANNLANVNTPGFKKGRVSFEDLVYRQAGNTSSIGGAEGATNFWQGNGVGLASLTKSFAPGELRQTNSNLDIAIQGEGFLEFVMPDGSAAFGRGGTLTVNKEGFLANSEGQPIKPTIHIGSDAKDITIQTNGRVLVRQRDQVDSTEVGQIGLVRFSDTSGLIAQGSNMYRTSEGSGEAIYGKPNEDGLGSVAQGFIESSNVKLVEEMVDLMVAQRAYETSVKVIQASDEMLSMSNNLRK